MKLERCLRWISLAACVALGVAASGCASGQQHPPAKAMDSKSGETSVVQECQRVANEAARLRTGAVSASNSGRRDAALTLFDQSLDAWRQITSGALRCEPNAVTSAYEQLDKTMREREETNRLTH